jgi:5-methylthioadenosine/S-adenosylhomocysteine deaminase
MRKLVIHPAPRRIVALALAGHFLTACAAQPSVDMIVAGDYVVTMEGNADVVKDGAVVVDGGMIVAVGRYDELAARYHAREVIAGDGRVVLPGLINGHTHAAMSLLRGIADDRELIDWLNNYIFPTERRFVDADFVRVGTELACWEMIRGGTTTFVDMYYFPESVARAVESCGLRVLVGPSVIDQKSPDANNAEESLRLASDFVSRWKGKNNRIVPIIAAHAIYTLKPEQLVATRAKAQELGVPISIHISESRFEIDYSLKNYGKTPVTELEDLNFFAGPTIGAHLVWPTAEEIPILARRHVGVIHNPTSNMKISSGVAPVTQMLKEGVAVGLDKEIGALTVGRRADLIQVSLSDVHFTPLYDVISHLVYVADEQDVRNVVVDGKLLMREGKILTVDEKRVRSEAEAIAARIRAAVIDKQEKPAQ